MFIICLRSKCMKFEELLKLSNSEKIFEHPIKNVDEITPIDNFSIDHRIIKDNPIFSNSIHFHKYFEMEIVLNGSATHLIDGETVKIKKGYICLLNRNDFHSYNFEKDENLELFNIAFDESHISPWVANQLTHRNKIMHCFLNDSDFFEMVFFLYSLYSEFKKPDDNFKTLRKSLLNIILLHFLRHIFSEHDNSSNKNLLVQKALLYIEDHFLDEGLSLQIISDKLEVTPNYLGKRIKENIGISFNDYVTQRKLEHALKLLNQNKLNISSIAKICGFTTSSYFIVQFKKQYHMTPKEYIININKT